MGTDVILVRYIDQELWIMATYVSTIFTNLDILITNHVVSVQKVPGKRSIVNFALKR